MFTVYSTEQVSHIAIVLVLVLLVLLVLVLLVLVLLLLLLLLVLLLLLRSWPRAQGLCVATRPWSTVR
jgi:hypothetical protein